MPQGYLATFFVFAKAALREKVNAFTDVKPTASRKKCPVPFGSKKIRKPQTTAVKRRLFLGHNPGRRVSGVGLVMEIRSFLLRSNKSKP